MSGFLLLDRDAREAGMKIAVGNWEGTPLLPLALRAEESVSLIGPAGRVPIALRAGALGWVRGAQATIEWGAVPDEVSADRLMIDGADKPVRLLAEMLGAEAGAQADGRWELRGPELFERTSFLDAPDGVLEALPASHDAAAVLRTRTHFMGSGEASATRANVALQNTSTSALVGVYSSRAQVLVLDAEGGFSSRACEGGEVRGRWTLDSDGRVQLTPAEGAAWSLQRAGETLRDAAGELLAPIKVETVIATTEDL